MISKFIILHSVSITVVFLCYNIAHKNNYRMIEVVWAPICDVYTSPSLLLVAWSIPILSLLSLNNIGCTLLLVLAHGTSGALRLRVTQFINGVIHIEVITNGSCPGLVSNEAWWVRFTCFMIGIHPILVRITSP